MLLSVGKIEYPVSVNLSLSIDAHPKRAFSCAAGAISVFWKMDTKHRIGYAIGFCIDYAKREARCNECTALRAGYHSGTYIVPFEFACC